MSSPQVIINCNSFAAPLSHLKKIYKIIVINEILDETSEKWLRRGSKIFSAKRTASRNHDRLQIANVISGNAENL